MRNPPLKEVLDIWGLKSHEQSLIFLIQAVPSEEGRNPVITGFGLRYAPLLSITAFLSEESLSLSPSLQWNSHLRIFSPLWWFCISSSAVLYRPCYHPLLSRCSDLWPLYDWLFVTFVIWKISLILLLLFKILQHEALSQCLNDEI